MFTKCYDSVEISGEDDQTNGCGGTSDWKRSSTRERLVESNTPAGALSTSRPEISASYMLLRRHHVKFTTQRHHGSLSSSPSLPARNHLHLLTAPSLTKHCRNDGGISTIVVPGSFSHGSLPLAPSPPIAQTNVKKKHSHAYLMTLYLSKLTQLW